MICNFDPRRNIPYAFSNDETLGHHIEIMPYSVFLNRLINNDGVATFYEQMREIAHNWRKNNIRSLGLIPSSFTVYKYISLTIFRIHFNHL